MTARPLVPATRVVRCFSLEIVKQDVHGVPASAVKIKARIISTVLRYHSRLETVSLLVTPRAHIVRRIALFFSRDAISHSRRVFRL